MSGTFRRRAEIVLFRPLVIRNRAGVEGDGLLLEQKMQRFMRQSQVG